MSTWLTTRKGTNYLSSQASSEREKEIKHKEELMVDDLNKLTIDKDTNLPVLTRLQEESDLAKEDKLSRIEGFKNTAVSDVDKIFAGLYKSGVTEHGKTQNLQRDLSKSFQTELANTMQEFKTTTGGIEDEAITQLTGIKRKISDTENLMEDTSNVSGDYDFSEKRYETTMDTETKPLEVEEDMWKYDYLTGIKDEIV